MNNKELLETLISATLRDKTVTICLDEVRGVVRNEELLSDVLLFSADGYEKLVCLVIPDNIKEQVIKTLR